MHKLLPISIIQNRCTAGMCMYHQLDSHVNQVEPVIVIGLRGTGDITPPHRAGADRSLRLDLVVELPNQCK